MTQQGGNDGERMVESAGHYDSVAADKRLYRRIYRADNDQAPKFGVLMAHGWGDHLACHEHAAQMFVDRGGLAMGFDWPGNGKSAGVRGHLHSLDMGVDILSENLSALRGQLAEQGGDDVSLGIYAHSTGCVMALKFLAERETDTFKFAWLGSPLAKAEAGQAAWKLRAAGWVAKVAPWLPFDTGVRPAGCRRPDPKTGSFGDDSGCHPLISAGFGDELARVSVSGEVAEWGRRLSDPLQLLMTLCDADTVCPPQYGHELFDVMTLSDKTVIDLPDFRHEPLRDPYWQEAVHAVEPWLDRVMK